MGGYALNDIPRSGAENMAIDQRMLEYAAEHQCALLRVYSWSEPTLSLGYFQRCEERGAHQPSKDLPMVRRATGGGAIVHHHDWTYCVALSDRFATIAADRNLPLERHPSANSTTSMPRMPHSMKTIKTGASQPLYNWLHDGVVSWLHEHGVAAQKWSESCARLRSHQAFAKDSFLCFQRRSCGDIVVGEDKVMGSAQRRMKGAILQHGSLLLATSAYAPDLSGLAAMPRQSELDHLDSNRSEYRRAASDRTLAETFFRRLKETMEAAFGANLEIVESLEEMPFDWAWPVESKFADAAWTRRV